jgi:hypothetical protein
MSKLGLLKDSDFKCMHDRKLPVSSENQQIGEDFIRIIEQDVRFLEGLRIMDYSLFLIVLEVPKSFEEQKQEAAANNMSNNLDGDQSKDDMNQSKYFTIMFDEQEQKRKEEEFYARLDELIHLGRFVMYSPSKRFVYLMGLIDYLGKWNMQKRFEMYGKTFLAHFIRQNTDFSVKPPHEFANRFLRKVKRVFRIQKKQESKPRITMNNFSTMLETRQSSSLSIDRFNFDIRQTRQTMMVEENKIEEESSDGSQRND